MDPSALYSPSYLVGAIAGIVIGFIGIAVLVAIAIVFYRLKTMQKNAYKHEEKPKGGGEEELQTRKDEAKTGNYNNSNQKPQDSKEAVAVPLQSKIQNENSYNNAARDPPNATDYNNNNGNQKNYKPLESNSNRNDVDGNTTADSNGYLAIATVVGTGDSSPPKSSNYRMLKNIKVKKVLGEGNFGKVYEGSWDGTPVRTAIIGGILILVIIDQEVITDIDRFYCCLHSLHSSFCLIIITIHTGCFEITQPSKPSGL